MRRPATTCAVVLLLIFLHAAQGPLEAAGADAEGQPPPADPASSESEEAAAAPTEAEAPPDPINTYYGRYEARHPAKRCCHGVDCLKGRKGRHAFVTTVRTGDYMPGFRELACSLQASNPGTELVVLGVEGELSARDLHEIEQVAEYRLVEDLYEENEYVPRFGKNWVKLRAWEWEDYDAIIMLDADMVVVKDLTHLFDLPTDFAWAPMQGHSGWNWNRGGFIMLRPCRITFESMLQHMHADEHLLYKKTFAEQSFLSWFFRYTAFELPMKYNLNFAFMLEGQTPGGEEPVILHFADRKPFNAQPNDPEWPYLCWQRKHYVEGSPSAGAAAI